MSICLHLHISGKVQGVCYRASSQMQAHQLGLMGFSRNLADGRVEIMVQGEQDIVQQFIDWCHRGPAMAKVTEVEQKAINCPEEFGGFDVRY